MRCVASRGARPFFAFRDGPETQNNDQAKKRPFDRTGGNLVYQGKGEGGALLRRCAPVCGPLGPLLPWYIARRRTPATLGRAVRPYRRRTPWQGKRSGKGPLSAVRATLGRFTGIFDEPARCKGKTGPLWTPVRPYKRRTGPGGQTGGGCPFVGCTGNLGRFARDFGLPAKCNREPRAGKPAFWTPVRPYKGRKPWQGERQGGGPLFGLCANLATLATAFLPWQVRRRMV